MDVVYPRCCGLDVHKRGVVACLVTPGADGAPTKEVRAFTTMTDDLLALADWLAAAGCTHVAMESTGVYWKPVYNLLEDGFALLLVNARHVKAVPGRKTDAKDCEWLADLLRHGLLQASFVPDRPQRELRELTRYRTSLVRERTAAANRLQKTLEGANIKLAAVATDVLGKSGRAILAALIDGQTDAAELAQLATRPAAGEAAGVGAGAGGPGRGAPALPGRRAVGPRRLPGGVDRAGERRGRRAPGLSRGPTRQPGQHPRGRPPRRRGLGRGDRDRVPGRWDGSRPRTTLPRGRGCVRATTRAPGAPWAMRQSGKTRKGSPWLRALLVQAAHAAARTKGTYLAAQYRRLAARRGKSRAAVAVGHTILVIAFHLLRDGTTYRDLGSTYFDQLDREHVERRLVHRLRDLGYRVTLEPIAAD